MLLDIRKSGVLAAIAVFWVGFLAVYIGYPYTVFRSRCDEIKSARVGVLAAQFEDSGLSLLSPSGETGAYVSELNRVRSATINPMRMASWQTTGFVVAVMLPLVLTAVQIAL